MAEIIRYCFDEDLSCGLLALDMRKAFDMLDRQYLLDTLKQMGFGDIFINYIKCLFNENFTNITTGGVVESQFKIERGVRQGDGISALLFIIALQPLMSEIKNLST